MQFAVLRLYSIQTEVLVSCLFFYLVNCVHINAPVMDEPRPTSKKETTTTTKNRPKRTFFRANSSASINKRAKDSRPTYVCNQKNTLWRAKVCCNTPESSTPSVSSRSRDVVFDPHRFANSEAICNFSSYSTKQHDKASLMMGSLWAHRFEINKRR